MKRNKRKGLENQVLSCLVLFVHIFVVLWGYLFPFLQPQHLCSLTFSSIIIALFKLYVTYKDCSTFHSIVCVQKHYERNKTIQTTRKPPGVFSSSSSSFFFASAVSTKKYLKIPFS